MIARLQNRLFNKSLINYQIRCMSKHVGKR